MCEHRCRLNVKTFEGRKGTGAETSQDKMRDGKNVLMGLTDVFDDKRRSICRSDVGFGGRTSLGRSKVSIRNGLISSRNFYGRIIKEPKRSWAETFSGRNTGRRLMDYWFGR